MWYRSERTALWGVALGLGVLGCSPNINIVTPVDDAGVTPTCVVASDTDCDPGPELLCVDTSSNNLHCRDCGRACPADTTCAGGQCCAGPVCGTKCLADEFTLQRTLGPSECVGARLEDLDGDGYDDAVFPCQLGETVEIFWGNAEGTLGTSFSVPSGRVSPHMAFGDVDEDDYQDMLTVVQGMGPPYTDRIRVFFGGPGRTFPRQADILFDGNARALALTDLDADGHLDVLIDRPGATEACMVLLPGNGRGVFETSNPLCVWTIPAFPDDNSVIRVLTREVGLTRLARTSNDALWIVAVTDEGVVESAVRRIVPGADHVVHVSVLEGDGDGQPDMVVTSAAPTGGGSVIVVRDQEPPATCGIDSGFAPNDANDLGIYVMGAGDFNGDGLIDVVGRAACCELPTSTLDLYIRAWTDPPFN